MVIGRNFTKHADILHEKSNALEIVLPYGSRCHISLFDVDMHCYIPLKQFLDGACSFHNLTNPLKFLSTQALLERPWSEVNGLWKRFARTCEAMMHNMSLKRYYRGAAVGQMLSFNFSVALNQSILLAKPLQNLKSLA